MTSHDYNIWWILEMLPPPPHILTLSIFCWMWTFLESVKSNPAVSFCLCKGKLHYGEINNCSQLLKKFKCIAFTLEILSRSFGFLGRCNEKNARSIHLASSAVMDTPITMQDNRKQIGPLCHMKITSWYSSKGPKWEAGRKAYKQNGKALTLWPLAPSYHAAFAVRWRLRS